MNILMLAALGYGAYKLLSKDDRPAKLREAASTMFAQAQQLEAAGHHGPAQSLRNQAQALLAQAASLGEMDDTDDLGEFGRSWKKKLKRHLSPVGHLKAARRVADQLVGEKKISPARHAEATQMASDELNRLSASPASLSRKWSPWS